MKRFNAWPMRKWVHLAVLAVIVLGVLLLLLRYAPFYWPSYCLWTGLVLAFCGFVSLLVPLRFLLIASRKWGAAVFLVGATVTLCGLFWPFTTMQSEQPTQRIDDYLRFYTFFERHSTVIRASTAQVEAAAMRLSMADMPLARILMRLRNLAVGEHEDSSTMHKPLLGGFLRSSEGFVMSAGNAREYVGTLLIPTDKNKAPASLINLKDFAAFNSSGFVKVAFNFHVQDLGAGRTRLSTETRIMGNDPAANRVFARYWHVIYPGSAITRRLMLDAIAVRAEQQALAIYRP